MTETEYLQKHFPKDFIKIDNELFVLPLGFELSIDINEIGNTLTTADGTKRKDIIAKTEKVTLKYNQIPEGGFQSLTYIVYKIENASFETEKQIFIKKPPMANTNNIYSDFKTIRIDVIDFTKYAYKFRTGGMFIYSGITIKIN